MWLIVALLVLLACPAMAQPADCVTPQPAGPVVPMSIEIAGRPGVPAGVQGRARIDVPIGAPAGNACHDEKPLPRDVLRGDPGDLLAGPSVAFPPAAAARPVLPEAAIPLPVRAPISLPPQVIPPLVIRPSYNPP
jgi:hypothetical protein